MNQRLLVILLIALVLSGGASYVVYRMVTVRAAQAPPPSVTQVWAAARTLEIGTLLKDTDLKTAPWIGPLPKGMGTKKEALLGRGVIAAIYEGEPILENRLAALGSGGGLPATIPSGMRACAVRVNDIVGVAGFVVPGMRVDVLITGNPPGATPEGTRVKTLLQNIEVLSAGQNYQKDAEGKPVLVPVVNLLVTPEQAEILSLASNETRIQLVLRNPLDTEPATVPGTAVARLFGQPKPPAPAPSQPRTVRVALKTPPPAAKRIITLPPYQIEIINGGQRSEAKFDRRPEENQ